MTVNTAILMNDQYNTTLQLIEDMQFQLNNIDIENVDFLVSCEDMLTDLEDRIMIAKNRMQITVEL